MADGCYSLDAQCSAYTVSAPGWLSILTGVWPNKHQSLDNSFENTNYNQYPTIFK